MISYIIPLSLIIFTGILTSLGTIQVYAQNQSTIIDQTELDAAKALCQLPFQCVDIQYESPTTIVMTGQDIVAAGASTSEYRLYEDIYNPGLWKVVDMFKAKGFAIDKMILGGQGTEPNPHKYHVVMSK